MPNFIGFLTLSACLRRAVRYPLRHGCFGICVPEIGASVKGYDAFTSVLVGYSSCRTLTEPNQN